jgi:hypothetical protein
MVTALCAVYFLLIGLGMRGALWAAGVAIALTSLLFAAVVHAAVFGMCYLFGQAFMRSSAPRVPVVSPAGGALQSGSMVQSGHQDVFYEEAATEDDRA